MPMKQLISVLIAICIMVSCMAGCAENKAASPAPTSADTQPTQTTLPPYQAPDGNPKDVTCKGNYTGSIQNGTVVARVGDSELTSDVLQALYALEVTSYVQNGNTDTPDLSMPLHAQPCPIDSSVNTWQQYFLQEALNTWHTAQALYLTGQVEGLPVEDAFNPQDYNYEKYMQGMPATKYLYRWEKSYSPNSMHQEYLDNLPTLLDTLAQENGYDSSAAMTSQAMHTSTDALLEAASLYNTAYMYFSTMQDYLAPTQEAIAACCERPDASIAKGDNYADIRHFLLIPDADNDSDACVALAEKLLKDWSSSFRKSEGSFAELAYKYQGDTAAYQQGGSYWHIRQGDLIPQLDSWVFDPERQSGDTTILTTEMGVHVLYYSTGGTGNYAQAENQAMEEALKAFTESCKENYPITVTYRSIVLAADPDSALRLTYSDILYADVAHERFPEVPLYLQQDYLGTNYGSYTLAGHGCGITSLAMLATYMTDTELTPPEMCRRYGRYCFEHGTDAMIFTYEPPVLGFYLLKQVFDPAEVKEALQNGYVAVSSQLYGYWTSRGHYIVLEQGDEEGAVVRDSNIYNYWRVPTHKYDHHPWHTITANSTSYWIYDKKPVRSHLCQRCGTPDTYSDTILTCAYLCKRCNTALVRRNCYLGM